MLGRLKYLAVDPPPLLVFEISEQAIAGVRRNPRTFDVEAASVRDLAPGVLEPAAGKPNVLRPDEFEAAVQDVLSAIRLPRRPDAALILPDASSRLTVLDFDELPADTTERLRLIRWRLKKTVPFDIEAARISFQVSPSPKGVSVMVAVTPADVVRQYEMPFEHAGLWPGFVSLSTAASLNLLPKGDMTLFAKLAGRALTMTAVSNDAVRMVRCVDLPPGTDVTNARALDDVLGDLYPTVVFVNDEFGTPVSKLVLCGFEEALAAASFRFPKELGCKVEFLQGPKGAVGSLEAGIWGYLSMN
jgi:type IV pilus assembly protein PilM